MSTHDEIKQLLRTGVRSSTIEQEYGRDILVNVLDGMLKDEQEAAGLVLRVATERGYSNLKAQAERKLGR